MAGYVFNYEVSSKIKPSRSQSELYSTATILLSAVRNVENSEFL